MPRRYFSRVWIAILCAVALLVTQQAALAHSVAHVLALAGSDEPSIPHSKICDQCNQVSQLGLGLLSKERRFDIAACFAAPRVYLRSVHEPAVQPPFSSRAPPKLLG